MFSISGVSGYGNPYNESDSLEGITSDDPVEAPPGDASDAPRGPRPPQWPPIPFGD